MKKFFYSLLIYCILASNSINCQNVKPEYLHKAWRASWITVPEATANGYGVYLFRKTIELKELPKSFPVHVTGDNRYKLFVNEKLVSIGPARGDVSHWNYETVDLLPYLQIGKNVIAAQVWNEGDQRPTANISLRTGFLLQGGCNDAQILNTNNTWKCIEDKSYQPIEVNLPNSAYAAGPGEFIDMNNNIDDWYDLTFNDDKWHKALNLEPGKPKNKVGFGDATGWLLIPSTIPQMELKDQRMIKCVKSDGLKVSSSFPSKQTALSIPANSHISLLLDQTYLTNAYPTIIFSGGKDASISLGYAESLYASLGLPWVKNNRNEYFGKLFKGKTDSIISNGKNNQIFIPLTWRTFRYLQINIYTKDSPLTINDVYSTFTGYPFEMNAKVVTDNSEIKKLLDIGWRTARLCAMETYMDCPYYEQLQYIGDTRIQALISFFNSGDDRLVKNALNQFEYSQEPEGVTYSRYPSSIAQYIPPFSLWYVGMVHDYMMYGSDISFVKSKLNSVHRVLDYFRNFQQPDGSVKYLPWWNFTDWVNVERWFLGVRVTDSEGNSALIDFQLLWAYQLAADMEQKIGLKELADIYLNYANQLQETIKRKYWDNSKKLFADNGDKDLFSQHTNSLAILTHTVNKVESQDLGEKLLKDTTLAPASIYFKYYLHRALIEAGFGNNYLSWLDKWRENINLGLTTWAETSDIEKSRSDCHAWGASPNIEIYRTILGIDSDAPEFKNVRIEPHLGNIKNISGEIPHPNGRIIVKYIKSKYKWNISIYLPINTYGTLIWGGQKIKLNQGMNTFEL